MRFNKKNILIIILCIALIIVSYIAFGKKEISYDEKFVKQLKDSLVGENKKLYEKIEFQNKKQLVFENRIDSLEKVKQEIKIQYVKVYKKIDNLNASELNSEFDSLFRANNVR